MNPMTYKATLTAAGTDGLLTFVDPLRGQNKQYIPVPSDWSEIIVEQDITAATGTSPTLDTKLKTVTNKAGTAPATGTMNATDGGGAAFAMTQATGATRELKKIARKNADADGAGVSNVSQYVALFADYGGTTPAFTGEVYVTVK